jgi:peroxiredoxin
MSLAIGDPVPTFTLPAAGGGEAGLDDDLPAVVVFTCNHCPYALAWHDRILGVARQADVPVLLINPNDAERYPRDSFEAMQQRVNADGGWPAPYLRDEDQSVARAFGAKTTPDVFVVGRDGTLAYRGAPDSDYQDPSQDAAWLRAAIEAVLDGRRPDPAETEPVGCSVKWKA